MTKTTILSALAVVGSLLTAAYPVTARADLPKKVSPRSIWSSEPSGYTHLGNTALYYKISDSIDIVGQLGSKYYSSTYSNRGYFLAMKVGDNAAVSVNCLNGATNNGVTCTVSIEPQGELGRVIYTVTNNNEEDVTVSLGTHADIQIGNNDSAPISRKYDILGNAYGIAMRDGNGAQLCVLFGAGLVGVNGIDDFWFGNYSQNKSAENMCGNYTGTGNIMNENGGYDSGMGICWKNRNIPANSSVEFSYLIGVGDVNLEPSSNFSVTPDDPEGWNNLALPHTLTIDGDYESPAGQNGKIQYAVEDSDEWIDLTEELESGSTFSVPVTVMFTPGKDTHYIKFRTVDTVGNETMLPPITYKDMNSVYPLSTIDQYYNWGEPIVLENVSCNIPDGQFAVGNYQSNTAVGRASYDLQGLFPYTIGKKTCYFNINPLPLNIADLSLIIEDEELIYNGNSKTVQWSFSDEKYQSLVLNTDYTVSYSNNIYPGTAQLIVRGKGNFSGELTGNFTIEKSPILSYCYYVYLPSEDIIFDNESHGAQAWVNSGVGEPLLWYTPADEDNLTMEAPSEPGKYDIYLEIAEGECYLAKPLEKVFTFTIYPFDQEDWATIQEIAPILQECGLCSWDLSSGFSNPNLLYGISFEEGKVVGLYLDGGYYGQAHAEAEFPIEVFKLRNLKTLKLIRGGLAGDVSSIVDYLTAHPEAGQNISTLDLSVNELTGNIGALAACFPNLKSLSAHYNRLTEVSPMISPNVEELNIENQKIDNILEFDMSSVPMDDFPSYLPQIMTYDHSGRSYSKPMEVYWAYHNTDGTYFQIGYRYANGEMNRIELSSTNTNNVFKGANGDKVDVAIFDYDPVYNYSFGLIAELYANLSFGAGDSNFDGDVNILDIQSSILYIFDENEYNYFNLTAADAYKDGVLNVQDIVCTADILLGRTPTGAEMQRRQVRANAQAETDAYLFVDNNKLYLYSTTPVAALDIIIDGDATWNVNKYGLSQVVKGNHIVAYSLSGMTIPTGVVELAEVENFKGIIDCTLSDAKAKPISVSLTNVQSGINGIDLTNGIDGTIFNTSGQRVKSLNNGVNIIVTDKGVKKVLN